MEGEGEGVKVKTEVEMQRRTTVLCFVDFPSFNNNRVQIFLAVRLVSDRHQECSYI